jgi:N-acetylmuramoyl-L-alanine amidase
VAIDAGHGGKDTGAVGHNGTQEKQVTYAIARKLERLVRAKPGMRPLMVRKSDTYIGLRQRTEIARLAAADLFISVHADAYSDAHVQGSAVYVLSPKRTEYTAFAQSARESRRAAARVLGELSRQQDVHHRFVQKARYAVLESPKLPALLVETGFLSNPDEERRLSSPAHQEKIARCIFNGVRAYFQSVRPAQGIGVKDKPVLLASRQ